MTCAVTLTRDIREIDPINGWRQFEIVGAAYACSCGASGKGTVADIAARARPHCQAAHSIAIE